MSRKRMGVKEFNQFMKRCDGMKVRYVQPTIHAGVRDIVALNIITIEGEKQLKITNNPDPDFDLNKAAHEYLDELGLPRLEEGK